MHETDLDRLAVELDVVVSCSRFGLMRGKATRLGMDGILVRTDARVLSLCSDVTVTFQAGHGGDFIEARGRIEGHSDQTIDVVFSGTDPEMLGRLGLFLRAGTASVPEACCA